MSTSLNTTANGTSPSSCSGPSNHRAEKIGETIAYCLFFVVSMAGNSFIVIIVYKTKTMRKPINLLILSMAMSDLLYPIFAFPWILTELYFNSWQISGPFGQILCKLIPFLNNASITVSIQSLVLIAVDRFRAVVFPLRSPLISSKLCPFFILATWIVAVAIKSPDLFAFKLVQYPERLLCTRQWNELFGESLADYYLAIIVIFFYTPLVLIAVLYIIVVLKLKSQKTPGEQSVNAGQRRTRRERNVLKMAIAIVLVFAVCWLPISIYWILVLLTSDNMTSSCGFRYFAIASFLMADANCAINPCICFIFSGNYRQGLKNLLR